MKLLEFIKMYGPDLLILVLIIVLGLVMSCWNLTRVV